jgi:mono/diheme cytochrome c family protein
MKRRILSVFLAMWLGLFVYHTSWANDKDESKRPTGDRHWTAPSEAAKRLNPVKRNQTSIKGGKRLFVTHCVVCHGPQARGDGPAAAGLAQKLPDFVMMAGHHSDGDVAWKIANGRGAMPAWKGTLSEKDIWDLTNFIQSLGKRPHHHESQ